MTTQRHHIIAAIRARRRAADITQQQLAQACGLTKQRWTRIENGLGSPNLLVVEAACQAVGLTLTATDDNTPKPDSQAAKQIRDLRTKLAAALSDADTARRHAAEAEQRAAATEQRERDLYRRLGAAETTAQDAQRNVERALAALDAAARQPKLGHDFIDQARKAIRGGISRAVRKETAA